MGRVEVSAQAELPSKATKEYAISIPAHDLTFVPYLSPHSGAEHRYGMSLVCKRRCRARLEESANLFVHILQTCGRSPVLHELKSEVRVYD